MNLFRNGILEIDLDGEDKLFVVTKEVYLANRINRALGNYYPGGLIENGAEAIFKLKIENSPKFDSFMLALGQPLGNVFASILADKCPLYSSFIRDEENV